MRQRLFALHMSENGDFRCKVVEDFDKWVKELNEGWGPDHQVSFLSELPEDWFKVAGKQIYLLIKGDIVIPKAVEVVKEYVLP